MKPFHQLSMQRRLERLEFHTHEDQRDVVEVLQQGRASGGAQRTYTDAEAQEFERSPDPLARAMAAAWRRLRWVTVTASTKEQEP